jgi:hypothetical protein
MRRFLLVFLFAAMEAAAAEFHVSPAGSPQGSGAADRPWDLATAWAALEAVQPGDTLWLHAGTYRGGFESKLTGRPGTPIVVRGAPGERATIDLNPRDERDRGALFLEGSDVVYRDFEVTCSHPVRVTQIAGSWPADIRRGSVDVRGDRITLANLVIHDLSVGVGFWSDGEGGEISGCLIYNNGWQGPDRAHGHGVYTQNARGVKRIADNVIFHQFAYGIHAYGSEKASLRGYAIEGNIAFENGALARGGDRSPGILVGGGCPAANVALRDNVVIGGSIRLGYPWGTISEDAIVTGNYCDGALVVRDFRRATVSRNTIIASSNVVQLEGAGRLLVSGLEWDHNDYYVTEGRWGETAVVEHDNSRGLTFEEWRRVTGCDAHSKFTNGAPTQLRVVVRPNPHEPGRAHIAVVNPQSLPEVDVDLSRVLKPGQEFRIVSVKDFYGPALVTGKHQRQPVRLPMRSVTPPPPVGMSDARLPETEPKFAAFVVLPAPGQEP